ncbi:MAG: PAS domain S-box protein [Deltaproteobacteria bacterium]|nr:PAS domain S-box protein [Deltaproteobacteria bacterium]
MVKKPTYEELEQRVKELAKEAVERERAEDALKDSARQWQTTFDAINDVVCLIDMEGNMLLCNKAMANLVGKSSQEIIGRKCWELVHGTSEPIKGCPIVRMKKTHRRETMLLPVGDRWFNVTVDPLLDEAGNLTGAVHIINDITELKQAEKALRAGEEKFDAMLSSIGDHMSMMDKDLNIIWANDTAKRIFGNDIVGKKCFTAYHRRKEPCEPHPCLTLKVFQDGKIHEHDIQVLGKDGAIIHFHCTANVALRDEEGKPTAVIEISRDITDAKRVEEALAESEHFLVSVFDSIQDGISVLAPDLTIRRVNEVMKEWYAQNLPLEGKKCYECYHNKDKSCDPCPTLRCIASGKTEREIVRGLEGSPVEWVELFSYPMKDSDSGEVTGVVEFVRDITDRKQAEEEKRKLEIQLRQSQKMEAIGTLAGGIAHDFNNLLMGIQGHTSLALLHTDPDHPHFTHLKGIEDMVQRGSNLTRQLLGFARQGKYEVKPTDLNELIEKSSKMFGQTKKEIRIHRKYQKEIWAVEVDRGQIEQVLLNLYVNAWQAMPRGGNLYISTSNVVIGKTSGRAFDVEPGDYVLFTVTDTGTGMDRKTIERIFDPFFTTKEIGQGTGLGLASAYGIVKAHGGHITIESEQGRGTTVGIYLPASEKKVEKGAKTVEGFIKGTETVLLVDDEEVILEVGQDLLESMGYRVLTADYGEEAIEVYKRKRDEIDIVLLDMIMPGMSGGEVYDRIKEINPDIKVLLSSGYSVDSEASEILERGCDGFIQKPFKMNELSGKLREVLDRGETIKQKKGLQP